MGNVVTRWLGVVALLGAGCGVELEHGLDERQANDVLGALAEGGLQVDKLPEDVPGRYTIVVDRDQTGRATSILRELELPREPRKGITETFAGNGLLPSPLEERARYAAALAVELERTLEHV